VLLAEHEPEVAEMAARYLARAGLTVRSAPTPALALARLADGTDAVAVLDLTMPGADLRQVRRALRASAVPAVFLLTGPRPRGLGGAARHQWITRPFGPRALVTAVREMLGSPGRGAMNPAASGVRAVELDQRRRRAVVAGREVRLTASEFAMLAALTASPGRVLTRRRLLEAVGHRKATERAADVHIAQLRAKIGSPGLIRTVRGAGYVIDSGGQ
jgi:two-component system, OmpR family, response regulator